MNKIILKLVAELRKEIKYVYVIRLIFKFGKQWKLQHFIP